MEMALKVLCRLRSRFGLIRGNGRCSCSTTAHQSNEEGEPLLDRIVRNVPVMSDDLRQNFNALMNYDPYAVPWCLRKRQIAELDSTKMRYKQR